MCMCMWVLYVHVHSLSYVCAYAALAHMLVLMCMCTCTYVLPRHVANARMCPIFVSCMCVCVFVSVCMSVCMYVCGHVLMGVCVCLHASMPAFTHVSTDVHDTRTIHVRPYIYVAYDGYVLGQCRAERAGSRGPQGCALAAASSALRRLHSLQLFLM
jgi:uncharacterized membrane protein